MLVSGQTSLQIVWNSGKLGLLWRWTLLQLTRGVSVLVGISQRMKEFYAIVAAQTHQVAKRRGNLYNVELLYCLLVMQRDDDPRVFNVFFDVLTNPP